MTVSCLEVLGLRVRIGEGRPSADPNLAAGPGSGPGPGAGDGAAFGSRSGLGADVVPPPDLEVSLLGEEPWPAGLLEGEGRLSYSDPDVDFLSALPILQVWEHGAESIPADSALGLPIPQAGQQGADALFSPAGRGAGGHGEPGDAGGFGTSGGGGARHDPLYRLRYWDQSEFLVDRAGARVWARWPASVPEEEIRLCLLGPIVGFVLHLRGTPCLHASAVAIDGRAVAFLGHSGMGKSTTAAAFVARGYAALTDDVLALDEGRGTRDGGRGTRGDRRGAEGGGRGERRKAEDGGREAGRVTPRPDLRFAWPEAAAPSRFLVRPGHNVVRLWPDAVRAIYGSEDALPHGGASVDKRHLDLAARAGTYETSPLPLGAIYVIADRRDDVDGAGWIAPLKGHEALMALVARTYMNYVLDATLRGRALTVFARLASQVPIRQLVVRHDPAGLPALTDAILADLARL